MKPYYQDKWVTIYHGDCREVLPELAEKSVDLVLTDPPYGVEKAKWDDTFLNSTYWLPIRESMKDDSSILVFTGLKGLPQKLYLLASCFEYQWVLSWYKSNAMQFGKTGFTKGDLIFWFSKGSRTIATKENDVIVTPMGMPEDFLGHPTAKPQRLISNLIGRFNSAIILDPFLGSGTTCYCAKKLLRKSIGIEIEERYCEIAARRCSQEVMELTE